MSAWRITVYSNFGAPEEAERTHGGQFDSAEAARRRAESIVLSSLRDEAREARSVRDLYERYGSFGEDPVISPDLDPPFSGFDVAKRSARAVFFDRWPCDIPAALRKAYRETDYRVQLPDGDTSIRIGEAHPAIDDWLRGHDGWLCSFLTACNPASTPLPTEENAARMATLVGELREAGIPFCRGAGRSPDGRWSEDSLLVLVESEEAAERLAARLGQWAFLSLVLRRPAVLRVLSRDTVYIDEADLPR